MAAARVEDVAALQALTPDSILAVAERVASARSDALGVSTWGARAHAMVVPGDLFGNIRRRASGAVEVLIGSFKYELIYFLLSDLNFERTLMRENHEKSASMCRSFASVRSIAEKYMAGSADPIGDADFAGE